MAMNGWTAFIGAIAVVSSAAFVYLAWPNPFPWEPKITRLEYLAIDGSQGRVEYFAGDMDPKTLEKKDWWPASDSNYRLHSRRVILPNDYQRFRVALP